MAKLEKRRVSQRTVGESDVQVLIMVGIDW